MQSMAARATTAVTAALPYVTATVSLGSWAWMLVKICDYKRGHAEFTGAPVSLAVALLAAMATVILKVL